MVAARAAVASGAAIPTTTAGAASPAGARLGRAACTADVTGPGDPAVPAGATSAGDLDTVIAGRAVAA